MKIYSICCVFAIITVVVLQDTEAYNNADSSSDRGHMLQAVCRNLCSSSLQCPRACAQVLMEQYPTYEKRAPGFLDGFTFDDYLFMRLLGRDMQGRRR